jgi:hypothetical protein
MPTLSKKNQNPFKPDQVVKAAKTFAWSGGVVHQGETYRGDDPAVAAGWTAFVDGATLDQELENLFEALPPPPEHAPPVHVQSTGIPAWRQVVCTVDTQVPVQWAKDSPGAASGAPPPFVRSLLRRGQILDALSDVVKQNPGWFRWPGRDVSAEDIERLERHERDGGE